MYSMESVPASVVMLWRSFLYCWFQSCRENIASHNARNLKDNDTPASKVYDIVQNVKKEFREIGSAQFCEFRADERQII